MKEPLSLADMRREYAKESLRRADLDADPIAQFQKWFQQALKAGLTEPNAMTLATADKNGRPSARIVLLKGLDERGFTFATNYESQKGRELADNPRACLVFYWAELERQVRVDGAVTKVARAESVHYFNSRPRASRLAALASRQSQSLASRADLEAAYKDLEARYPGEEVPCPAHWGGYRLVPDRVEFWQGRPSRLHDRFLYTRQSDGKWQIERLSP